MIINKILKEMLTSEKWKACTAWCGHVHKSSANDITKNSKINVVFIFSVSKTTIKVLLNTSKDIMLQQ